MNAKQAQKDYLEFYSKLESYGYAINLISFDGATEGPKAAYEERAKAMGTLLTEIHKMTTSDAYDQIIKNLENNRDKLSPEFKRIAAIERKNFDLSKKIPTEEYEEYQILCSRSEHFWEIAKEKNDFKSWEPYLEKIVETVKKFGKYYGEKDGSIYNTYLDMYEEDANVTQLDEFFDILKKRIVPLVQKIQNSNLQIRTDFLTRPISKKAQLKMSNYVLKTIGYDFKRGMLKESVHPFTNEISLNDVRVTTHIIKDMFMSNLFSCVHEGGHGIYDQNLNKKYAHTPLYNGASMAFHESQSRFYENIVARSKEFCDLIFPKLQKIAPKQLGDVTNDEFYLASNKAEPSLIRTESDELTYCLHIMLRYEIEKKLMSGEYAVKDLPTIWNNKMKEYLGVVPPTDTKGVLQDMHWSDGSIGYFFSYAVGNAYSAQIYNTMKKDLDVASIISSGNLKPIKDWLKKHIYVYGSLLKPAELIKEVTGEPLNANYYCDYLEEKFSKIYNLK